MPRGLIRSPALVALLAFVLLVPAEALADRGVGTLTTPSVPATAPSGPTGPSGTKAPKPKPKKPAVRAHPRLYLFDSFFVGRNAVTVPNRLVHVHAVVFP